ncbi:hypothetical protein [Spectribacter hydrogenoxidans]|uniref:Transglycosylase SLT domain-containing protein n=1 Tax=Spectribacter hydrogenoxidans TaxID=3075608 RepID=A0ABU3C0J5_9GAMM|nr:hypothetical protein [Salinisphaera sp. W335]MDT0635088.1 hypothetical protein [Salinisphaera sp. W335]
MNPGINADQLREYVIEPVLSYLHLYSPEAVELLILTAAHESAGGHYLHQVGGGPALGIYQMEPATHDDIWRNYLEYRHDLDDAVNTWRLVGAPWNDGDPRPTEMTGNLYYATAMARIHYLRVPKPLPAADDLDGLAGYWKAHYNTFAGAGTVAQAREHYRAYVGLA